MGILRKGWDLDRVREYAMKGYPPVPPPPSDSRHGGMFWHAWREIERAVKSGVDDDELAMLYRVLISNSWGATIHERRGLQ